jgi:hypothetical protein
MSWGSSSDDIPSKAKEVAIHAIDNKKARQAADRLADFLDVVAKNVGARNASMSKDSDGFCFIAKNSKTKKFHGHAGMNIGDDRFAVTFQQQTVAGCESYIYAWANHALTGLKGK